MSTYFIYFFSVRKVVLPTQHSFKYSFSLFFKSIFLINLSSVEIAVSALNQFVIVYNFLSLFPFLSFRRNSKIRIKLSSGSTSKSYRVMISTNSFDYLCDVFIFKILSSFQLILDCMWYCNIIIKNLQKIIGILIHF